MASEQEEKLLEVLESIDESLIRIADAITEGLNVKIKS